MPQPREFRDPALSKSDPMITEPIKIPKSILTKLTEIGLRQGRYRTYVIRTMLEAGVAKAEAEIAAEAAAKKAATATARKGA